MIKQIELNGRIISYDLQIKPVKNVNLRIKADQSVFVSANESVSPDVIDEFLKSKTDYIVGALDHYAELQKYAPKPKEYVDGETFRILGHELRLKVSQGTKNQVTTDGAYILLQVKNPADYEMKSGRWKNGRKSNAKKFCFLSANPCIQNFKNTVLIFRPCATAIWFQDGGAVNPNGRC